VSVDANGNIYVVDTGLGMVMRITQAGTVDRVAPDTVLKAPARAVADATGNVYVSDAAGGNIFRVDSAGVVSTLLSKLAGLHGLALDAAGHLYFSEQDGARVGRLDLIAGDVVDIGAGAWSIPRGIALSSAGELFVADTGRQQIMRVDSAGQVTAVAGLGVGGSGTSGFSGDGGAASSAQFNFPWDVAITPRGVLYVADLENHRIRRLTPQPVPDPVIVPPGAPAPEVLQILNAASAAPGPIAPGMLLVVRGSGIPATDAAGTVVLINSIPVPILAMDASRIQVQSPFMLATPGEAEFVIVDNGSIRAQITVPAAATAPALYPVDPIAAAAAPGAVVTFYGTGLGLGDLPVTATLGGIAAEVVSLDSAPPGFPGLFQISLRVPAAASPGLTAAIVIVGGVPSQTGVNMLVSAP
jgi:uncharacterized protein (TIGR03437 family)